jgi:KUP system potassium uptake protein
MKHPHEQMASANHVKQHGLYYLTLGALGIVFGDIGTSPLYALRESFHPEHGLPLNPENILGVLGLIFWTLIAVICVKYMAIVMRADNKGEGGILSLMALAVRTSHNAGGDKRKVFLTVMGLFGAALLYGDGAITPAISVLSAVEGLSYITPFFEDWIVAVTIVIIAGLFFMQKFGTGKIGVFFGPIMLVWFLFLGALGIYGIQMNPEILKCINPIYAFNFFQNNVVVVFAVMGSVFLVVTGGEALYADMGHFGRKPIRVAWFFVAMPALVLNYMGQGALLLSNPAAIVNPFYMLAPKLILWPTVILSTVATVIASQALISGVFSITRQAVQLGFCPRVNIVHTSSREIGQIYIPFINWTMFLGVVWLVIDFKTSSSLAAAYGIAVTATMVITTILAYEVAINKWNWSVWKSLAVFGPFFVLDFTFFFANSLKISHGGYIPLMIGAGIYLLMSTWQKGRKLLYQRLKERSVAVEEFCENMIKNPPQRVSGTAMYMAGDPWGIPVPLLHNLKHNKVLHERIAMLTIITRDVPFVMSKDRVAIQEVVPNFYRIIAHYGFMETPKMKHILDACRERDIHFSVLETTFVLGRETILASNHPGMPLWQEHLFAVMTRNAQRPTAFFKIPPNQVIEVGIQVEI